MSKYPTVGVNRQFETHLLKNPYLVGYEFFYVKNFLHVSFSSCEKVRVYNLLFQNLNLKKGMTTCPLSATQFNTLIYFFYLDVISEIIFFLGRPQDNFQKFLSLICSEIRAGAHFILVKLYFQFSDKKNWKWKKLHIYLWILLQGITANNGVLRCIQRVRLS